ncbi:MAG: hypothetical protein MJE77_23060 [Proteobacteria bacterium]|nr:hypothetical protein [Pseudomonadota bacterium]
MMVGGTLIGQYWTEDSELGPRNVLMVALSKEPRIRLGALAAAFSVSGEHLRRLRRTAEREGMQSLFTQARGGSESKLRPRVRARLEAMFADGYTASEAYRAIQRY